MIVTVQPDQLEEGMLLAQDIVNYRGEVLLVEGTQLNYQYIEKIIGLGLEKIHIKQNGFNDDISNKREELEWIELTKHGISRESSQAAYNLSQRIFAEIEKRGLLGEKSIAETKKIVEKIIEEIITRKIMVGDLEEDRIPSVLVKKLRNNLNLFQELDRLHLDDDYTCKHSVNVCVLSLIIGLSLNLRKTELLELGLGALWHDVGKVMVCQDIINKPGPLEPEEREEVEKHSWYAYEILSNNKYVSPIAATIAYEHHEKYNGGGYPQGLTGEEINRLARIVSVADVYDALVSNRCYRSSPMYCYEAAEIILASSGYHFDPQVVQAFLYNVDIYPLESLVELNDGRKGVVTGTNRELPTRPVLQVYLDNQGNPLPEPIEVDLARETTLFINKVV